MNEKFNFPEIKYDLQTRFGSVYDVEEARIMQEVLNKDAPTSGKYCKEFEKKFANYIGAKYSITVSNGTAALMMAYKAVDIKPGDEVITTPITWIATAAAADVLGAKIKFADINPETFNIDPDTIRSQITEKTKAICPVHLYGQAVDIDPIREICDEHNIFLIEDAAHAPGGEYKGKKCGNLGDLGCFSFHEQKNMTTLGEGGMITTNNEELYERARGYKSHCARVIGESSKYLSFSKDNAESHLKNLEFWYQDFDDCGYNFRMNDITAAVGLCQLKKLDANNKKRIDNANKITEHLRSIDEIEPLKTENNIKHVFHLYPILVSDKQTKHRNSYIYKLRKDFGIKTGIHYMPLVQTNAFKNRGFSESDTPIANEYWKRLITLPIHPRLTDDAINYMIKSISTIV